MIMGVHPSRCGTLLKISTIRRHPLASVCGLAFSNPVSRTLHAASLPVHRSPLTPPPSGGLRGPLLRFAKEVLNYFQLAFVQDALAVLVAHVLQGLEEAAGLAEFLAEEVDGTLVAMVGVS